MSSCTMQDTLGKSHFNNVLCIVVVCKTSKADIVVIADSSTSIDDSEFAKEKDFIGDLVERFGVSSDGINVGLITFSTNARLEFGLTDYTSSDDIKTRLKSVDQEHGDTYTAEALTMMTEAFREARGGSVPKIGILITDGVSQEPRATKQAANVAKDSGIALYTIGMWDSNFANKRTALKVTFYQMYLHRFLYRL